LGTAVGGLVAASALAGVQVAVLLVGHGHSPGYCKTEPEGAGDTVIPLQSDVTIWAVPHSQAISASIEFARRWRPDVIHVHVFWLAHVAAAVRKATGAPLVYTVHSLDRAEYELGQGPPECVSQWPIQSDLINDADMIIALTDEERGLIGQYCPEASDRVRVVGNGIADNAHARKSAQRRHPRRQVTVLYTGRFVERKGIRELLNAAPAILEAEPHTRLVMAGGHRYADTKDLVDYWMPPTCEPFRDRIVFTGWLNSEQLDTWYCEADILVVPSWYEPFGMVILEGMLYGLPIVAARVGGPKDILVSERTGLFCEPKDVGSLSAQVIRLIRDPALRVRIGREAAVDVRSRWLHGSVLNRMQNVYAETAFAKQGSTERVVAKKL
jgi:glycogen(starch) synthase